MYLIDNVLQPRQYVISSPRLFDGYNYLHRTKFARFICLYIHHIKNSFILAHFRKSGNPVYSFLIHLFHVLCIGINKRVYPNLYRFFLGGIRYKIPNLLISQLMVTRRLDSKYLSQTRHHILFSSIPHNFFFN